MQVMQEARYVAPVRMMKLTQEREVTPYVWVHPDETDAAYYLMPFS
jgi:hypothetical protein